MSGQLQPALDKLRADRKPQRLEAIQEATRIRVERAAIKRDITDGRLAAADVIAAPPDVAVRMPIMPVLMAQVRWGRLRSLELLQAAGVWEGKTLGALTDRQRGVLVDLLRRGS